MIEIGDKDFPAKVLKAPLPAVLFCYAEWAGPCNLLRPEIEAVAAANTNSLRVFALNIEDHSATPIQYAVKGVPALLLFDRGELVASKVGAITAEQIVEWLIEKGVL